MRKVILLIAMLISSNLAAQYDYQWNSIYHGNFPWNGSDIAFDVIGDNNGNLYVTGISFGEGTTRDYRYDAVTIKYNQNGDSNWVRRYNNIAEDIGKKIKLDENNNVYIAGESFMSNGIAILLCKYDSVGNNVWIRNFHDTVDYYRNTLGEMIMEINGDFYIGGYSYGRNFSHGSSPILLKFNSHGVLEWSNRYSVLNHFIRTYSIYKDENNIYATGSSSDSSLKYRTFIIIKYDLNGNIIWIRNYNFGSDSESYSVKSDNVGNVYIAGYRKVNNTDYEMKLIKYNQTGNLVWIKSQAARPNVFNSFSINFPNMINIDSENNVYVSFGIKEGNILKTAIVKYNSEGNQIWIRNYGISQSDFKIDYNGNLFIIGSITENFINYDSYAIIKYDQAGKILDVLRNINSFNEVFYPQSLFIYNNGDIASTGSTKRVGSSTGDYLTLKYSHSVGITQTSTEIPSSFSLSQNFPNPFNPTTNIRFQIPESGFVTLKVFDITGREVATLVNEQMNAGEFNYQFATDEYKLSSGVYFYRLTLNGKNGGMNFSETKKMILLR